MRHHVSYILFLIIALAFSHVAVSDTNRYKKEIELYNDDFDAQVSRHRDKNLRADISFKKKRKFFELIDSGDLDGVTVEGFKHHYGEHGGGYVVAEGESLHEAGRVYQDEMLQMSEQLVKDMQVQLIEITESNLSEKEKEVRAGNIASIEDLRIQIKELNSINENIRINGVEILGVDINGEGKNIEEFKEKNDHNIYVAKIKDADDTSVEQPFLFEE